MRVPPHSREAEEGVLGGLIVDNRALDAVLEILAKEDFYISAHQLLYDTIVHLHEQGQPVDIITLSSALTASGRTKAVGGIRYLSTLTDASGTARGTLAYAGIVRDRSVVRRTMLAAQDILDRGSDQHESSDAFVDFAEQKIFAAARVRKTSPYSHVAPIVSTVFGSIEAAAMSDGTSITGLTSGFAALDALTAGFQPADLIIVAGRPSMGKTALALNVTTESIRAQVRINGASLPVMICSLEMSKEQLVKRMLCAEGRVDSAAIRRGYVRSDDWPRLIDASTKLSQMPIFIDDTAAMTVMDIRSKARRLMSDQGLCGIIVDYLQLMTPSQGRDAREREISEISRGLKALAKELNIPVIALSQLSRGVEARPDKRPKLSDLRESGAIEQDADLVLFLYRDEVYYRDSAFIGIAELIVGKQRNGPIGTVRLRWTKEYTRFEEIEE